MKKDSAVEWLIDQMFKQGYFDGNKPLTFTNLDHLQQQAKEMEKEQMKYFIQVGYYAHSQGHTKDDELYNYWIDNYNRE